MLPPDSKIPIRKLTHYLLVPRAESDKSNWLAKGGYTLENPERFIEDLSSQICACNIVSVKVQSTSKPALRQMERSGIGLSAGRRPLQEPETGLVGARPQLDNGGVKI